MKALLPVFLVACGGAISAADAGSDAATVVPDAGTDASAAPFDPGAFCTGATPKLMINGADVAIGNATGRAVALDCCDSAELTLVTPQFQAPMNIMWLAGPSSGTIDLASPPTGFGIEMDLGCDPATTACANASPEERYLNHGFTGTLQYTAGSGGYTVSYCFQLAESPSQPHATIHSMALYAPSVASP